MVKITKEEFTFALLSGDFTKFPINDVIELLIEHQYIEKYIPKWHHQTILLIGTVIKPIYKDGAVLPVGEYLWLDSHGNLYVSTW